MQRSVFYHNKDSLQVACKYWAHKGKASGLQKVLYMLSTCHQLSVELGNNQNNVKKTDLHQILQHPYGSSEPCGPSTTEYANSMKDLNVAKVP